MKHNEINFMHLESVVATAKREYKKIRQSDQVKLLDEDLVFFLDYLNDIRGIGTIHSCSGHRVANAPKGTTNVEFYVGMLVTGTGLLAIMKIVSELNLRLNKSSLAKYPEVRFILTLEFGRVNLRIFSGGLENKAYLFDILKAYVAKKKPRIEIPNVPLK